MLALQVYKYAIQLNKHVYLRVMRQESWYSDNGSHLNNHIWCCSLRRGRRGYMLQKNIFFPGISYPQTFLQAILQIYVYESLVSSPNARNTLPWIVGKPVKLRSYFLVPMKSFPGFPSIFSTITITRAVAWPESGAPQTLLLMKISTQHFKLFTFLETILCTKHLLNYFLWWAPQS